MTTRSLAIFFASTLALTLSGLAGCSSHVGSEPGQHGDNIDDSDSSSSYSSLEPCGGDPDVPSNAIAITLGTLEAFENSESGAGGSSSTGGGTGGSGIDPDTIVLQLSNETHYTCDTPILASGCDAAADTQWQVSIELAPSKVKAGSFDLSDPSLNAFYTVSGAGEGDTCWGGGGSFVQGQLVIDLVDETAIHFHLSGTNENDALDGVKSDGAYLATRCN